MSICKKAKLVVTSFAFEDDVNMKEEYSFFLMTYTYLFY